MNPTPSSSAQTAASRAFLAHRDSNASLSSAAAAAALRSHTPPPTSVEDVQTKRMLQRRLSNSSTSRGGSQASLRRSPSSGSMTTRTFRERSASSSSRVHPLDLASHPPMPPLPEGVATNGLGQRRSLSVQPRRRVVTSPPPLPSGRGASLDRRASMMQDQPPLEVDKVRGVGESGRPASRASINFSYPMNSPLTKSPIQSPVPRESPHSPRPDFGGSSPSSSSEQAAEIPPAVAITDAPELSEGGHLTTKTAVDKGFDHAPSKTSLANRATNEATQSTEMLQPILAGTSETYSNVSKVQSTSKARPQPKKWPSTVREEEEAGGSTKEPGPAEHELQNDSEALSSQRLDRGTFGDFLTVGSEISVTNGDTTVRRPRSPSAPSQSATLNVGDNAAHSTRQPSISPSRSARFANQLVTTHSNALMHEPPPRSMSPVKSALKQPAHLDVRGNSGLRHVQPVTEISDGVSVASDEGSRSGSRKKAPRVSFDDKAEVVGVAASPPTPSEPTAGPPSPKGQSKSRPSWFLIGKKKANQKSSVNDEEFEPIFSPRPSLPSFGSIRGSRVSSGEQSGEGVKGYESTVPSDAVPIHADISRSNQVDGSSATPHPDSSDIRPDSHVELQPGAAPLQDTSTVHESTNAVKQTSHSTEAQVSEGPPVKGSNHDPSSVPDSISQAAAPEATSSESGNEPSRETSVSAAHITIPPADIAEDRRDSLELRNIPGAFPLGPSDKVSSQSKATQNEKASSSEARESPDTQLNLPEAESSDDSEESIYSDAPDRLIDGDGFGSINAIVDSPLPSKSSPALSPRPPATESEPAVPEDAVKEPGAPHKDASWPLPPVPIVVGSVTKVEDRKLNSRPTATNPKQGTHLQKALDRPAPQSHASGNRGSVAVPPDGTSGLPDSLSRTRSNDSDSSSSFKRAPRPASRADGQIVMKRTLRDSRPASPPSFQPREPGTRGTRKSATFGTFRKKATLTRSSNAASSSRFVSRFADSSDEDEPLEVSLRPVRGIPRRYGEYDVESTDLDDSSDDGLGPLPNKSNLDGFESLLSQPRKGGLLARLTPTSKRGRKSRAGKVRKSDCDSPARRDTHLERSREELRLMKDGSLKLQGGVQNGMALSSSPDPTQKLQKFNKGISLNGKHVPEKSLTPDDTVNGVPESNGGPGIRSEDPASNERLIGISEVVIGKGGRKKRFPLLRRAFGLRD